MNKINSKFINMNKENIEAYTPKYSIKPIKKYLKRFEKKLGRKIKIWCPFSKDNHNYPKLFRKWGYDVINTHYDPKTGEGNDFLKCVIEKSLLLWNEVNNILLTC